jgi:hypothetical protein
MGHPRAWDAHRASRDANLDANLDENLDENLLQCASGKEVYFDKMNL